MSTVVADETRDSLAGKLAPTPDGSVYVRPQDMEWKPLQFEGIAIKVLYEDHDGICRAGEYVWRHAGSMHETHSAEGCTILAVYRKPNIFRNSAGFEPGGKRVGTAHKPTTFEP